VCVEGGGGVEVTLVGVDVGCMSGVVHCPPAPHLPRRYAD
jgi:hypothetical protein